ETFSTLLAPKKQELVATPYRFKGNVETANHHFENGLQQAFANMLRFSNADYPLSVYYAFKQSESDNESSDAISQIVSSTGRETMLQGLIRAGYTIRGTWPVRTERSARSLAIGTNALASSIVLLCRPRPDDAPTISRREFVNA